MAISIGCYLSGFLHVNLFLCNHSNISRNTPGNVIIRFFIRRNIVVVITNEISRMTSLMRDCIYIDFMVRVDIEEDAIVSIICFQNDRLNRNSNCQRKRVLPSIKFFLYESPIFFVQTKRMKQLSYRQITNSYSNENTTTIQALLELVDNRASLFYHCYLSLKNGCPKNKSPKRSRHKVSMIKKLIIILVHF